jgi:nitroreductase
MEQTAWIRSLRAVRQFSGNPVPDDVLRDILDTGRWTGSSKNTQPWDLVVVKNRETLTQLSKCGAFAWHIANATLAIALVMHGDDPWTCMDEGRLTQNLMLAAWAHQVGTCIGSIYPAENEQRARDVLGLPNNRFLRTVLSVGYPTGPEALRLPPNTPLPRGRRSFDDVVSWERLGNHAGG